MCVCDFRSFPFSSAGPLPRWRFFRVLLPSLPRRRSSIRYDAAVIRGHGGEVIVVVIVYPPEG